MPFTEQPVLDLAGDLPRTDRRRPGSMREMVVPFRDRTLRSVRVGAWQRSGDRWLCLLYWRVSGKPYEDWYVYDKRLEP